jgi:hypothetical protein
MKNAVRRLTILLTLLAPVLGGQSAAAQSSMLREGGRSAPIAEPAPDTELDAGKINLHTDASRSSEVRQRGEFL